MSPQDREDLWLGSPEISAPGWPTQSRATREAGTHKPPRETGPHRWGSPPHPAAFAPPDGFPRHNLGPRETHFRLVLFSKEAKTELGSKGGER